MHPIRARHAVRRSLVVTTHALQRREAVPTLRLRCATSAVAHGIPAQQQQATNSMSTEFTRHTEQQKRRVHEPVGALHAAVEVGALRLSRHSSSQLHNNYDGDTHRQGGGSRQPSSTGSHRCRSTFVSSMRQVATCGHATTIQTWNSPLRTQYADQPGPKQPPGRGASPSCSKFLQPTTAANPTAGWYNHRRCRQGLPKASDQQAAKPCRVARRPEAPGAPKAGKNQPARPRDNTLPRTCWFSAVPAQQTQHHA